MLTCSRCFTSGKTLAYGRILQTYSSGNDVPDLTVALNRVGHHIRERIVEQARASLGEMEDISQQARLDVPEPIPEDQEEINKQADAAIRDLFPRIPNTDRQIIIEHSFRKVCAYLRLSGAILVKMIVIRTGNSRSF